jgi:glycosyltransferase involved in cell wall biosynthesis
MKIVYIATGAANMYCGSCMRDNTLAAALQTAGHEVTLLPLYTPMRLDEESVGEQRIFMGGIAAYLLQKYPNRSPWRDWLLKIAGSQALVRLLPRFDMGSNVDPAQNGDLTLSMLRGETGNQRDLLEEMLTWLAAEHRPDVVYITNTLLSGLAPAIKRRLHLPVFCGLHGEDIFLDGLPPAHRAQALALIRENCASIDHFLAISQYYLNTFLPLLNLSPARATVVAPGIHLHDYPLTPPRARQAPFTIGYLARLAPEKGLHILADAFIHLARGGEFPGLRLRVAGYYSRAYRPYVEGVQTRLRQAGVHEQVELVGTVDRAQKLEFLRALDVFALPTVYRDPKGLPVFEAWASGVPVVLPDHGAFPEWIAASQQGTTSGGLLHTPEDPLDLAEKIASLLRHPEQRRARAEAGQKAVQTYFSSAEMAKRTLNVYTVCSPAL